MKALSWVRRRPKVLASTAGVVAGAVVLTGMAFAYDGFPTAKVDLNDAGVWLTKTSSLLVGHFNHESTVIDGGTRTTGEDYDVLQDAGTVLVVDKGNSTLSAIDPAQVSLSDSATMPGDAQVALGRLTAAILDKSTGQLWVHSAKALSGFDVKSAEPTAKLGKNAAVTVARDGTVYAVSGERSEVLTVTTSPEGIPTGTSTASLDGLDKSARPSITAVGKTPVVLDSASGVVTTPGGFRTKIDGADTAVLQQASDAAADVALATTSQLVRVPLDGGAPVEISSKGQGRPATPVSLRGCTYGAWAGSARFVRDCAGDSADLNQRIPGAESSTQLAFRVNRDVIVLNDVISGSAWLANESLQQVDDWSVLTPPEGESEDPDDTTQETVETTVPDRKEENTPPTAEDDSFGVRPGGTTLLPVLDNDNDPDGDVLVAKVTSKQPSVGTVQPILNGGALQILTDEKASGSSSFQYEASDGRGGKDTATVTVEVHDWKQNAAPKAKRVTKLAVEAGGTVSYNVLPDWIDPDGDDLYLRNVTPAAGDEATFTTDGQITYRAVASTQGRQKVEVSVSDALGEATTSTIYIDVKPAGSTAPKTNADHVVTRAGESITISPLANDTSSGREQLRLTRVVETPGAVLDPDFANKQFSFRAATSGVYYVQYLASAGGKDAIGLVRVDVLDKRETDLPPVAVRDVALLPAGGEVLVGVLGNDSDPAGGVLVLQSVTVPPHSGISVSVLNHETLRIGDQGGLAEPVRIKYRISNGAKSAEADVIVVPIPAPAKLLPPVAHDDQATVRAGDVVTIPVLDNDSHPNGDTLHVSPTLVEPLPEPGVGDAFVSQDTVRFRAGSEPGTAHITYEAVDSMNQKAAGYVTVQILPVDEKNNSAPRPRDLTARTLAGTSVQIAVPLDGIDIDGDSVELLGLASAPAKGQISEVGQNFLVYKAFDRSSGVDTFTYRVRDRLGKEGTATIRVGIAPPEGINQAPYAVKDSVVVRPGRSVAVPVLANDSDPDGDKIALVSKGLSLPKIDGLSARVSGDRVIIDVPDRELSTAIQYTVRDARGAEATAPVAITVDKNVPLARPIARDDRVLVSDVKDGLSVDLDILANDEDPDGTTEGLKVSVEKGGTLLDNRKVRVTVGEERQLVRYTVTDADDLSASAFIFVPARSELRPTTIATKPVEVKSGETKELPLSEYVAVAGGGTVRITEAAKVSAVNADGSSLIKDEHTLVYTSKKGFFGEDAITFEVTDGTSTEDPKGRKSTLTIPILVLPPDNQQPEFVDSEISVAPGEDATSLDLAALASDPDPADAGKLRFSIAQQPDGGVSARMDGTKLLVEASSSAKKGTATTVRLNVTDGTTEPVEGTVRVKVTASTRDLPVANTDTVEEADQGKTIRIPVLDNDINPFPDKPLKVVSAAGESGQGSVKLVGDEVEISLGSSFVGVFVARYRIQDATKDPDREVDGKITVKVQGVPDAPGMPSVSNVQDRTVVLSWGAPPNNGAEITEYVVKSAQGAPYTKSCATTTCTLTGLTNNVDYTFQVTAKNRVGEGPASPVSGPARPDARPDTPNPPTLKFGDKKLSVAWQTPSTPGSPVESYTLRIEPAPPSGPAERSATGNSLVWEGLENGANYRVQVQAHNRAPEPSSWSAWSVPEVPAGPPKAAAAPTTKELAPVGSEAQMEVAWTPPDNNGDAISEYRLEVMQGSSVVRAVPVSAGATSQAVLVTPSETGYTFRITAKNKAGWGQPSPSSAERRGVLPPGAPGAVTATAKDRAIVMKFTHGARNGARADEIVTQYRLNGGDWQSNWDGSTITGLTNGTTYQVTLREVAKVGGSTYAGPSSGAASAIPFGTPHAPAASAVNLGTQVQLSWNAEGSANGRSIQTVQVSIDGGGWQDVAIKGTVNVGNGYQQNHSISVKAVDAANQTTPTASASARTNDPPKPRAWTSQGPDSGRCGTTDTCYLLRLNTSNFPAGNYTLYCLENGVRFGGGYPFDVPENGYVDTGCWHGGFHNQYSLSVEIVGWGNAEPTTWD